MATISITGRTTELTWAAAVAPRLRVYAKQPFVAAGDVPVIAGSPFGGGRSYLDVATTLDGSNRVVVPTISLPSTEDSSNPGAQYVAYLYSRGADGSSQYTEFSVFAAGFGLPPTPTTQTWEVLAEQVGGSLSAASGNRTVTGNLTVLGNILGGDTTSDTVTFAGPVTAPSFSGNGAGLTGVVAGTGGVTNTGSTTVGADTDSDGVGIIDLQTRTSTRLRIRNGGETELFGPLMPATYTKAGLPAVGTVGRYARVTDDLRGLWTERAGGWSPYQMAVDVRDFATGGAGTEASPWTGWDTIANFVNFKTYVFPSGYYGFSSMFDLYNKFGVKLLGEAGTVLKHTGTGVAVQVRGDASPAALVDFEMDGFVIEGNAATTDGLKIVNVAFSRFDNIRVRNVSQYALHLKWNVGNVFTNFHYMYQTDRLVTTGMAAMTVQATNGIWIDNNLPGSPTSQDNIFINMSVDGCSVCGVNVVAGNMNTFIGGTSEGSSPVRFAIQNGSYGNTIKGMDLEPSAGTGVDLQIGGQYTTVDATLSALETEVLGTAVGTTFLGGVYNSIEIQAGAKSTTFHNIAYNVGGTGTIVDNSGTHTTRWLTPPVNYATGNALAYSSIYYAAVSVVSPTNLTVTNEQFVIADGALTVTIPTASNANTGRMIIVKHIAGAAANVIVQPASGTIDGAASITLARTQSAVLMSVGGSWTRIV